MRINQDGTLDTNELQRSAETVIDFTMSMVNDFTIRRTGAGELYITYIRRMFSELAEDFVLAAKHTRGVQ